MRVSISKLLLSLMNGALSAVIFSCTAAQTQFAQAGDDPIASCTARLKTIHRALIAYEKKHGQWPDHLSDLVPEFLPDQAALREPADPGSGDLGSNEAHADPRFRVSYSYERNADVSNGLAQPLCTFRRPDREGTTWGSWRWVNARMEAVFGDQVPLVRCYHHRPAEDERDAGSDRILNLTPSGRVYESDYDWRRQPESLAFLLATLARDLTQGPTWVQRNWLLWRVDEFLSNVDAWDRARQSAAMSGLADRLLARHRELVGDERAACRIAARLFFGAGQADRALAALDAAATLAGADWAPIVEDQLRAEIYKGAGRWNDEIATYQKLLAARPGVTPYMESLADAYDKSGQHDLARVWRDKADPGRLLVGKPAPAFEVALLDGTRATVETARRGYKALLLDFWFCACSPCRLSFPHLERLYAANKARGLTILAVNRGDSNDDISRFGRDRHLSFALASGRRGEQDNPIFRAYQVASYPTSFLIDESGKIVWRGVGYGPELKRELDLALEKLGFGQ
jgi:peroxiredoxin